MVAERQAASANAVIDLPQAVRQVPRMNDHRTAPVTQPLAEVSSGPAPQLAEDPTNRVIGMVPDDSQTHSSTDPRRSNTPDAPKKNKSIDDIVVSLVASEALRSPVH